MSETGFKIFQQKRRKKGQVKQMQKVVLHFLNLGDGFMGTLSHLFQFCVCFGISIMRFSQKRVLGKYSSSIKAWFNGMDGELC